MSIKSKIEQSPKLDEILVSVNLKCDFLEMKEFLSLSPDKKKVFFTTNDKKVEYAGLGSIKLIQAEGENRFELVQERIENLFNFVITNVENIPYEVGAKVFGGFSYFSMDSQEQWKHFGSSYFVLPEIQLTMLNEEYWLTINIIHKKNDQPNDTIQKIKDCFLDISESNIESFTKTFSVTQKIHYQLSYSEWEKIIHLAKNKIQLGMLDKIVLSRTCEVIKSDKINPVTAILWLHDNYPNCFSFLIEPQPFIAFYGASPEILVQIKKGEMETHALAGSIKRGDNPKKDEKLGQLLMQSEKNKSEHKIVVEQILEVIDGMITNIEITPETELIKLSNIQHLKTSIRGKIKKNQSIFSFIKSLHPTPAVGGMPKENASEIIKKLECHQRGWYASPIGWVDSYGNGCFVVGIRSALSENNKAILYAGAGIVEKSDPKKEWEETQLKFQPLFDALGANN